LFHFSISLTEFWRESLGSWLSRSRERLHLRIRLRKVFLQPSGLRAQRTAEIDHRVNCFRGVFNIRAQCSETAVLFVACGFAKHFALKMTDDEKQEGQPGFVGWPGEQTGGLISSLVRGGRPTDRHGFGIRRRLLHSGRQKEICRRPGIPEVGGKCVSECGLESPQQGGTEDGIVLRSRTIGKVAAAKFLNRTQNLLGTA
jgi:hypothetical protein